MYLVVAKLSNSLKNFNQYKNSILDGWVLGILGPGQLGPGQLGPGQLGPEQLGPGAQLSTF